MQEAAAARGKWLGCWWKSIAWKAEAHAGVGVDREKGCGEPSSRSALPDSAGGGGER